MISVPAFSGFEESCQISEDLRHPWTPLLPASLTETLIHAVETARPATSEPESGAEKEPDEGRKPVPSTPMPSHPVVGTCAVPVYDCGAWCHWRDYDSEREAKEGWSSAAPGGYSHLDTLEDTHSPTTIRATTASRSLI